MAQPVWKFVANLGDASPIDYGGLFLYRDDTGVYPAELERLEPPTDGDNAESWEVRRVCLDKLQLFRKDDTLYLVSANYDETWPHPVSSYVEWFTDSLDSVASTMGTTRLELEAALCSSDDAERAWAYQCIYDYHGWDNGDSYPLKLNRTEVVARYKNGEL